MPAKCLAQVTSINNNFLFTLIVLLLNISGYFFFNKFSKTNNISGFSEGKRNNSRYYQKKDIEPMKSDAHKGFGRSGWVKVERDPL